MKTLNPNLQTKKAFYGFRKAFIRNTNLSPEARLLLIILVSHLGVHPVCWPSIRTLSRELGRNTDSVRKYLWELKLEGYLKVESRGIGRSLLYTPSYWKTSSDNTPNNSESRKPTEETISQPAESTLNRSISSGNKDKGKEGFDKRRRELGLC